MTKRAIRKVQLVCFLISHIPLACLAVYVVASDAGGRVPDLLVGLAATVVTALLLLRYLGRTLTPVGA